MLTVNGLKVSYGALEVLHGIDLTVEEGEIVTLIGANGAGKSSTLRAFSGIITGVSGQVVFRGSKLSKLAADKIVQLGLVHVPEGRRIFSKMTVRENLDLGAYLIKNPETRAGQRRLVFQLFPVLEERQYQLGGTLSGGEQQMLAIARGLMAQPRLLMLDEPSMGVAPIVTKRIFDTLAKLNRDGLTILLVEQNANLALRIASRGYVLEGGRIVLSGLGAELLDNDLVRQAYLGG